MCVYVFVRKILSQENAVCLESCRLPCARTHIARLSWIFYQADVSTIDKSGMHNSQVTELWLFITVPHTCALSQNSSPRASESQARGISTLLVAVMVWLWFPISDCDLDNCMFHFDTVIFALSLFLSSSSRIRLPILSVWLSLWLVHYLPVFHLSFFPLFNPLFFFWDAFFIWRCLLSVFLCHLS